MKLNPVLGPINWFFSTPERALNRAYQATKFIEQIENEHFNGQKVAPNTSEYGNSVLGYFKGEVNRSLSAAKVALAEFKVSRSFLILSEINLYRSEQKHTDKSFQQKPASAYLEKLKFIDAVINRYSTPSNLREDSPNFISEIATEVAVNGHKEQQISKRNNQKNQKEIKQQINSQNLEEINEETVATVADQTSVLPRSFIRTLKKIQREIDSKSQETEEEVLKNYRLAKYKTSISLKFILILIIVPLLTHQVTKTFLISPVVNKYFAAHEQILFINTNLEEEAFQELHDFEERLHFKSLIGIEPKRTQEEIEEEIKHKADEIAENFRYQGANAIANIFADIFSLVAFAMIIATSKKEIVILKSFLDDIVYGLSDSAKAFLIILITDMFVGFHSPHGWEVILEGIARHLGLPENRDFNFLFIATFPVILDTVLKYWIFRYLNRISPSSVATYRNMNE